MGLQASGSTGETNSSCGFQRRIQINNTNTQIQKYTNTAALSQVKPTAANVTSFTITKLTPVQASLYCGCVILAGMAFNTNVSDNSAEPAESLKFLRITAAVRGRKSLQQRAGETVVRWFPASRRSHLQQFPGISVAGWRTQEGLSGSHPFTRANLTHHLPSLLPSRKLHRISSK